MPNHPTHIAKKRFGQHFLQDPNYKTRLIQAINPKPNQTLVEIGPGPGALTEELLALVPHLTAIEIDRDLASHLTQHYSAEQLTLFNQDALTFDLSTLTSTPLRLVGNLPYNISTPLLFHVLQFSPLIEDMHFMLQKEVVDRMAALPNTSAYGRLSVMIQYACEVTSLFKVPPGAFSPPPKVDSAVVRLKPRPFPIPCLDTELLSHIVQKAFEQRRKTLHNALKGIVSDDIFEKAKINPQRRAETLSVEEFVRLANTVVPPY